MLIGAIATKDFNDLTYARAVCSFELAGGAVCADFRCHLVFVLYYYTSSKKQRWFLFTETVPILLNKLRCPRRVHLGTGISSTGFSA